MTLQSGESLPDLLDPPHLSSILQETTPSAIPSGTFHRAFLRLLRGTRQRAGLTQQELARRIDESQSFVSKCERGERRLDIVEVHAFCSALGVSFQRFAARLHPILRK